MSFKLRHLFGALILHGALFALPAGGVQCSRPPVRPPVIEAVLLDPNREQVSAQKRKEQERRRVEEQRRKAQEQKRREEAQRQERARAEAEAEQQRKAEAEAERRRQAEADAQRKAEDARKQKELAQKKKAEEDARKKREEDTRREQEAKREAAARESLEQAMQREQLQRQLEQEQQARAASAQDARRNEWAAALQRAIERNWIRPQTASGDIVCTVRVQLLPDASVTYAKIEKSCGNSALDKSVEDAVFRSSPLPRPQDPSVFERELIINFKPIS